MRRTIPVLLCAIFFASPALGEPIASRDAAFYVGEAVTVKGRAFLTYMPSGEIYIDLDGRSDGAPISAYISRWNRGLFQDVSTLDGKMVEVSGQIGVFRDRPEIFLQDPRQLTSK